MENCDDICIISGNSFGNSAKSSLIPLITRHSFSRKRNLEIYAGRYVKFKKMSRYEPRYTVNVNLRFNGNYT